MGVYKMNYFIELICQQFYMDFEKYSFKDMFVNKLRGYERYILFIISKCFLSVCQRFEDG